MSRNHRIFFDMDGVLVDFDSYMRQFRLTGDEVKRQPGAYLKMEPIEHAISGIRSVLGFAGQNGYDVWLATKPPTGVPWAYADKVAWVLEHLPELKRRIILTHDKGLLGDADDILVDDRIHKANCQQFRGALIHFGPTGTVPHWHALLDVLGRLVRHPLGARVAMEHETEATLDEVNEARGLLRLGPIGTRPVAPPMPNELRELIGAMGGLGEPVSPAAKAIATREQLALQAGVDAVMGPGFEYVPSARPAHGGYPGRFGGGRFGNSDAAGEERDRHPKA